MMETAADSLASGLQSHIRQYGRAVLVIDGDCAAGKTTLAAQIAARLQCNLIHMDDFFLPPALRTEARLAQAGGNVDYERFLSQVLAPLVSGRAFAYGAFSCADFSTTDVSVTPGQCTIIEGSYALHPRFLDAYKALRAIKLFLRVPENEQIRRIRQRNGEAMLRRFRDEWIPMEKRYQAAFHAQWDDVQIIDG